MAGITKQLYWDDGLGPKSDGKDQEDAFSDNRSLFCEITGFQSDRHTYRRVAPAALDWNHAREDRWNPFLATAIDRFIGETSKPGEDATRVYRRHRPRDRDAWVAGSFNDIFIVPCFIHNGGTDKDGNHIRRLALGIDKMEWYHDDNTHGTPAHIGRSDRPPRGVIPVETVLYKDVASHFWRWKTWIKSGGWSPPTPTPTPGTPTPTPTPSPDPRPGPTTPSPGGGGGTTPSGGGTTPGSDCDPYGSGWNPYPDGAPYDPNNPGHFHPRGHPWFNPWQPPNPNPSCGSTSGGNSPNGGKPTGSEPDDGSTSNMQLDTRAGGIPAKTNQHARFGHTSTPHVFQGEYSNRLRRADRGWFGTPLFESGVQYHPARPDRGWFGHSPVSEDPGLIAAVPSGYTPPLATGVATKPDYTTLADRTQTNQDQHDSIGLLEQRTDVYNKINQISAAVLDLDCRERKRFVDDLGTRTIAALSTSELITTTYPTEIGSAPPRVQVTAIGEATTVFTDDFSQNADGTWDFTINVAGVSITDLEVDVTAIYSILADTEVAC